MATRKTQKKSMTMHKQTDITNLVCPIKYNGQSIGFINVSLTDELTKDVAAAITKGIIDHSTSYVNNLISVDSYHSVTEGDTQFTLQSLQVGHFNKQNQPQATHQLDQAQIDAFYGGGVRA